MTFSMSMEEEEKKKTKSKVCKKANKIQKKYDLNEKNKKNAIPKFYIYIYIFIFSLIVKNK